VIERTPALRTHVRVAPLWFRWSRRRPRRTHPATPLGQAGRDDVQPPLGQCPASRPLVAFWALTQVIVKVGSIHDRSALTNLDLPRQRSGRIQTSTSACGPCSTSPNWRSDLCSLTGLRPDQRRGHHAYRHGDPHPRGRPRPRRTPTPPSSSPGYRLVPTTSTSFPTAAGRRSLCRTSRS
jgi:hypothetical protein